MKKSKKIALIMLISIVIFVIVNIVYNNVVKQQQRYELYVLNKDVKRGDVITKNDVSKIYTNEIVEDAINSEFVQNDLEKYVINNEKSKNNIIFKKDIILKTKYLKSNEDKEIISIKFKSVDNIVSYKVNKNSIVNLYFTARNKYINGLEIGKQMLLSNVEEGYGTIEILNDVKILDIFNKDGVSIKEEDNQLRIIDSILIEVKKEDAKIINNLKGLGDFNITLIR